MLDPDPALHCFLCEYLVISFDMMSLNYCYFVNDLWMQCVCIICDNFFRKKSFFLGLGQLLLSCNVDEVVIVMKCERYDLY